MQKNVGYVCHVLYGMTLDNFQSTKSTKNRFSPGCNTRHGAIGTLMKAGLIVPNLNLAFGPSDCFVARYALPSSSSSFLPKDSQWSITSA